MASTGRVSNYVGIFAYPFIFIRHRTLRYTHPYPDPLSGLLHFAYWTTPLILTDMAFNEFVAAQANLNAAPDSVYIVDKERGGTLSSTRIRTRFAPENKQVI